jgi:hypothetical protein
MRVMVCFGWRVMPQAPHFRLIPYFPCNGKPEQEIRQVQNKIKFPQGFAQGQVYYPMKTVFNHQEDPSKREHRQQPKSTL